ncbi:DUF6364 family protein [Hymenobacter daeguensis]
MSTITLTLDDEFIAQAEAYAHRMGTDLATLFTTTMRPIIAQSPRHRRPISPAVAALAGSLPVPPDFDYKTALGDALMEKYL